jgi:hypothetical protein
MLVIFLHRLLGHAKGQIYSLCTLRGKNIRILGSICFQPGKHELKVRWAVDATILLPDTTWFVGHVDLRDFS